MRQIMAGHAAVMSALPYYFNGPMAALAVESGCHFSDLGGNTEIVFEQKKLDAAAAARGLSIIPDCGLAPGMVAILAAEGIRRLDTTERVQDLRRRPAAESRSHRSTTRSSIHSRARSTTTPRPSWVPSRREADAGRCAERAGDGGVPLTGGSARGIPHGRRDQHAAVQVPGPGRRHGVQDPPLPRPRRHHAPHPRTGPARQLADHGEGPAGRPARRLHRRGASQAAQARGQGPGGTAGQGVGYQGWHEVERHLPSHRFRRRRSSAFRP